MDIDIAKITKHWNGHIKGRLMSFEQYLKTQFLQRPLADARSVFQIFPDMLMHFGGAEVEEPPAGDLEFYGLVDRDFSNLLEKGVKVPYYPDILFGDYLVRLGEVIRSYRQQNVIYIFRGAPGCGKSTLLNNLLTKFEEYANSPEGRRFEAFWQIPKGLNGNGNTECVKAPCPSHDHPLLVVPQQYRLEFLDQIGLPEGPKKRLFEDLEFDWLRQREACTICTSLWQALLENLGSPDKVLKMLFVRRRTVSRRMGQGITVYNPGDKPEKKSDFTDEIIQEELSRALGASRAVQYKFSRYAPTNDGIYALMDIKSHNVERLIELHNIISEGVHKVGEAGAIEETVNSLFIALMNPEDEKESIRNLKSFRDRIEYITVPYARNVPTEIKIIVSAYGEQIKKKFLPGILEAFAAIIVSSRYKMDSKVFVKWLGDAKRYKSKVCDARLILLKIRLIQSGADYFPLWLKDEDRKTFTKALRRELVEEELSKEGQAGITGRDSLKIFQEFWSHYSGKRAISIEDVLEFFCKKPKSIPENISIASDILEAVRNDYSYRLLQQIKDSLFRYNEGQISRDIRNYIFAVHHDIGVTTEANPYTGDRITVTEDYLKLTEGRMLPPKAGKEQHASLRKGTLDSFTSVALPQEMNVEGRSIDETELYKHLFNLYTRYVKEHVLDSWAENENFRRAIKDYGTRGFESYDERIQEGIKFLLKNLREKYDYTEEGARIVSIYALDKNLAKLFAEMQLD